MESPCKGLAIIEFLNLNPLLHKTLKRLLRIFLFDCMGKDTWIGRQYRGPTYKGLLGNIKKQKNELVEFHKDIKHIIKSSISSDDLNFQIQLNSMANGVVEQIEKLRKATRGYFYAKERIPHGPRLSRTVLLRLGLPLEGPAYNRVTKYDIMTDILKPFLLFDLAYLAKDNCFKRLRVCSACDKIFLAKSLRVQRFCSDKCRFAYHNKKRIEMGQHKDYMKEWRRRTKTVREHANYKNK